MSHLVDHMFVVSARSLRVINAAGVAKIQRNMLALQQTMRSINQSPADGVLHLSSVYWDMYHQDPKVSLGGMISLTISGYLGDFTHNDETAVQL
jgi:exocyst complex component 4